MLSDYSRYLVSIRNSFIRSGVELSIEDINKYEDVFYLGELLSELLWFYSVLEISGSEDRLKGFMFPLNSFYMNKIRDEYFDEYLLYKAGYMQISTSDALKRNQKSEEISEYPENATFLNSLKDSGVNSVNFAVFAEEVSKNSDLEEDEFGDVDTFDEEDDEDEFSEWGNYDEEDEEGGNSVEDDDEDWVSYEESSDDDGFIEQETSSDEDEDEFSEWGSYDDEEEFSEDPEEFVEQETSSDEDEFGSWGNYDEDDFDSDTEDTSISEEDGDFDSWVSSDEEDDSDDEPQGDFDNWGTTADEEDDFSSWGNYEEDDNESSSEIVEDDDSDDFGSWGSYEEEETDSYQEEVSDDEDDFGSWGNYDSDSDEEIVSDDDDDFSDWGNYDEEEPVVVKTNINSNITDSKKSKSFEDKLNEEVGTNEKVYNAIGKMVNGVFFNSRKLKSKVVEKIKNTDDFSN